jgi:formylglycine-generating enzyme required for sulfatase activity
MNYLLISVLSLMLMACSEHKQNFPKASSQQTVGLPVNATKLPKTQLIHGWSKKQVQSLQQETAKAVGLNNGVSFHDNFIIDGELFSGPKLIVIPPAVFVMGCYDWDKSCFPREDIKALITINYPFAISEIEVSNADWVLCVKAGYCEAQGFNRSFGVGADFAVTSISRSEALEYVSWLSDVTGNTLDCSHSKYYQTAKSDSCYFNPKERNANPSVEQLQPNAFGLFNIHRGSWEWLQDCWHNNISDNTPKDGSPYKEKGGCKSGVYIARGGNMGGIKRIIRASNRHIGRKNKKFTDVGFRVAREIN